MESLKPHCGIRYLELCNSYNEDFCGIDSRIYNAIFDRINYLTTEKSGITDSVKHNFSSVRTDSYNSLPIKKIHSSCYNSH